MTTSVLVAIIGLLAAPVAAWTSWVLTKKQTSADISASLVVASAGAVDAIKDVMDTLKEELATTKTELSAFRRHNAELEASLRELHEQNLLLISQNENLANEIASLRFEVDRLSARE